MEELVEEVVRERKGVGGGVREGGGAGEEEEEVGGRGMLIWAMRGWDVGGVVEGEVE